MGPPTSPTPEVGNEAEGLICKGIGGFTRRDTSGHLSVGAIPGAQQHIFTRVGAGSAQMLEKARDQSSTWRAFQFFR